MCRRWKEHFENRDEKRLAPRSRGTRRRGRAATVDGARVVIETVEQKMEVRKTLKEQLMRPIDGTADGAGPGDGEGCDAEAAGKLVLGRGGSRGSGDDKGAHGLLDKHLPAARPRLVELLQGDGR